MRSTLDIIRAVKDSEAVTEEELRLAVLALALIEARSRGEAKLLIGAIRKGPGTAAIRADLADGALVEMLDALGTSPAKWLGPEFTPGTAEYERRRRLARVLAEVEDRSGPPPVGGLASGLGMLDP